MFGRTGCPGSGASQLEKSTTIRLSKAMTIGAALLATLGVTGTAAAGKVTPPSTATVTWAGNGTTLTEGIRTLATETCDTDSTPYLLWILAGSKATSATINIDGTTADMGRPGIDKKTGISTFKYTMPGTIDLDTATVTALYNNAKNKATLTISHGCTGEPSPELTVVFLGELYGFDGSDLSFGSLGSTTGPTATTSVCETAVPTNCVTFNASGAGTAPSASGTLTMSATGTLTLSTPTACLGTVLYAASVTPSDVINSLLNGTPAPIAFAFLGTTGVTTVTYSTTDTATVYIVTLPGC